MEKPPNYLLGTKFFFYDTLVSPEALNAVFQV